MERTTCKWALRALPNVVPILEEGLRKLPDKVTVGTEWPIRFKVGSEAVT
jgi:hypothetical protein